MTSCPLVCNLLDFYVEQLIVCAAEVASVLKNIPLKCDSCEMRPKSWVKEDRKEIGFVMESSQWNHPNGSAIPKLCQLP